MPFRAAIIGLGNIAWKYDAGRNGSALTHLSTYREDVRTQLVAGFDPDPGQRALFADSTAVPSVDSLVELLDQKPDIVSICSPSDLHALHLRACLEAAIPMIWLEKPATTRAEEAIALLALQRRLASSTVLVGFQRRYQPAYRRLRTLVTDGSLGECTGVSITYSRGLETNGVHLLDLLFFLFGDDMTYTLRGVTSVRGPAVSPSFLIEFSNGIPCSVTGLQLDYHSIDITVHFSAGRASVVYGGAVETRERRAENPLYPGFFRLMPDLASPGSPDQLQREAVEVFPVMLDDLISAHLAGRDPLSALHTAIAAQVLVERVLAEAAQHRK